MELLLCLFLPSILLMVISWLRVRYSPEIQAKILLWDTTCTQYKDGRVWFSGQSRESIFDLIL